MIIIKLFKDLDEIKKYRKPVDFWTNYSHIFSIRIVAIVKNTRITPDMITWSSLLVCLVGTILMLLFPQQYIFWFLSGILYQFAFILDCADGQLARFKEQFSPNGWRIDLYTDRVKEFLIIFAMTYVLMFQYKWFWIIGIITIALQGLLKYIDLQEILKSSNINFKYNQIQKNEEKVRRRLKYLNKISTFKNKYKLGFMNIGEFYFFNFVFILLGRLDWFLYILIIYSLFSIIYRLLLNINREKYLLINIYRFLENGKKLVLFGTGSGARNIMFNLLAQNINVAYASDNNDKRWGENFFGVKINPPEQIRKDRDDVNVLIASSWGEEIKEQLLSYGLDENQLLLLYN